MEFNSGFKGLKSRNVNKDSVVICLFHQAVSPALFMHAYFEITILAFPSKATM